MVGRGKEAGGAGKKQRSSYSRSSRTSSWWEGAKMQILGCRRIWRNSGTSDGGVGRTGLGRQRAARERMVVSWTAVACAMAAAGKAIPIGTRGHHGYHRASR